LGPAIRAGFGGQWPARCPLDTHSDVFAGFEGTGNSNKTAKQSGTCLADYCEVFQVCEPTESAQEEMPPSCDAAALARARQRCDQAMARCFPLDSGDKVTRTLHTRYSRQFCQVLDCKVRSHKQKEHEAGLLSLSPLLGIVGLLCIGVFFSMVFFLQGGDELLQLLLDFGLLPARVAHAREGLRSSAGFGHAKGC